MQTLPKYRVTVTLFSLGAYRSSRNEVSLVVRGQDAAIRAARRVLRNGIRISNVKGIIIFPAHRVASATVSEIKP
jgi:hypothetical protein